MITVQKSGLGVLLKLNQESPVEVFRDAVGDRIFHTPRVDDRNAGFEDFQRSHLKRYISSPRIVIGVKDCPLDCPYCNGKTIDPECVDLIEWVSATSLYSIIWTTGEPCTDSGMEMLKKLEKSSIESKTRCVEFLIQTNGAIDRYGEMDDITSCWQNRMASLTVSVLRGTFPGHYSIEDNFNTLMKSAASFAKMPRWNKTVRVVVPPNIRFSSLPGRLLRRLADFLEECRPDRIQPFYIRSRELGGIYHATYHPNIADFVFFLDRCSLIPKNTDGQIRKKSSNMVVDGTVNFVGGEVYLNGIRLDVSRPFSDEVLKAVDSYSVTPHPRCLECDAYTACPESIRKDWPGVFHQQYRDEISSLTYMHGINLINRMLA